jgi:hypothetical protein
LVPTLPRDGIIAKNSPVQGRTFTREYVELKLRIAKAEKNDTVVLRFESLSDYRFPPLDQVEKTEQRTDLDLARGIEAQFLDRFMGVCEACRATDRAKKDLPFVRFSYLGDPNEPMTFVVDDTTRGGNYARVTIMPVQL